MRSKSAFVTTLSGTDIPVALIIAREVGCFIGLLSWSRSESRRCSSCAAA
jgi:hypothetical protein